MNHTPTATKYGHPTAALFAAILALAGFANADVMSSTHSHKGKKGYLTITNSTEVEGVILQPGDYEVREVDSPNGTVVEFTRYSNEFATYGWKSWNSTVVARGHFTEQAMGKPSKRSRLIVDNTGAIALEIRGSAVRYEFSPSRIR